MKQPIRRPVGGLPRRVIAIGILMLARGQAEGLRHFDGTRKSVLSALTPLLAFILVGTVLAVMTGAGTDTLSDLFGLAIGFLGQLVFSYEVARRWDRAADWLRFATAFCWCQWAGPLALAALLVAMAFMMAAGVPTETTAVIGMVLLFGYGIWLHWFLARTALRLTALRALALVLIVNALTSVLVFLPQLATQG